MFSDFLCIFLMVIVGLMVVKGYRKRANMFPASLEAGVPLKGRNPDYLAIVFYRFHCVYSLVPSARLVTKS